MGRCLGAGAAGAGAGVASGAGAWWESSCSSSSVDTHVFVEDERTHAFMAIQTRIRPAIASLLRVSSEGVVVNAKVEGIVRLCLGGDLLVWAGRGFNFYVRQKSIYRA